MRKAIQLLIPNSGGSGKQVVDAVLAARGKVERSRIKLLARDTLLKELIVACDGEGAMLGIISSLESLDGVSVVGAVDVENPERR